MTSSISKGAGSVFASRSYAALYAAVAFAAVREVDLRARAEAAMGEARELAGTLATSDLALRVAEQRAELILLRDVARQLRAEHRANLNLLEELQHEVAGLKKAMESRAPIEQAKGILMAAEHCRPDEAFDMLTRASQRQNRKLALIAADIVERTMQPRETPEVRGPRARRRARA